MQNQTSHLQILPVTPEDAEALLSIYAPYVTDTAITFEYEIPSAEEFAQRIRHTLKKYPYIKAVDDGQIIGYAYAGTFVGRAAYDWAVETSIYVDRSYTKGGVGGSLYHAMEDILGRMNILNLNACIGVPCEGAEEDKHLTYNSVQFHEHLGYHMAGRFHKCGYKFNTWYDMVWMEKTIGKHSVPPDQVRPFSEIVSH